MRSKENFTSSEVSGSPLLNFSPSRSVQVWTRVAVSENAQLFAASGCGSVPPLRKPSSDWNTSLNSSQEAGSVARTSSDIPTTISEPFDAASPPSEPQPVSRPEAGTATRGSAGHWVRRSTSDALSFPRIRTEPPDPGVQMRQPLTPRPSSHSWSVEEELSA